MTESLIKMIRKDIVLGNSKLIGIRETPFSTIEFIKEREQLFILIITTSHKEIIKIVYLLKSDIDMIKELFNCLNIISEK